MSGAAGTGLVATLMSFLVVLAFLFLAVQVAFDLYTTTVVTATVHDAARSVALSDDPGDPGVHAAAEERARTALGHEGDDASFTWTVDADAVHLRVRVDNPRVALPAFALHLPFDTLERTVTVRIERVR